MLSIHPTEHLTGARISGDFWDIDELVNAIYHVIGDENRYYDYQGSRNRLLSICLDLRHATQGERQIEFVTNGIHKGISRKQQLLLPEKNVYFAVEILMPELIFCALALNDFITLHKEIIDDSEWNEQIATIRKFQAQIAECLEGLMEREHYLVFFTTLHAKSPFYFRYATQYVDVLNLEYLSLSKEERSQHLTAFALRLLMEDEPYNALKNQLLEATSTSKLPLHEIQLLLKYPEEIVW
ncbi:DUF6904 family protein [Solibacillus sp. FSL H8-0538]|uniref:DUF6904 family protein n=1 Tax=Solibacillus sp. FSL H8-0538 TaxID=2921400 RepID=UPI0030FB32AB